MENKSHALAAGTFVVLLLALLVALAVWLTHDTRALRVFELSSAEAVTGLQPQASVRFKGVAVGKVAAIGFDPLAPANVLIRIAVDEQAPITTTTFGTLGFQGVTGLAFVQLDDSGESQVRLPANQEPPARIPLRPGLMAKLSSQGEGILGQLDETSRRISQLLQADNQVKLMAAVSDMGQAAASLQQLTQRAHQLLPPLAQDASATLKTLQASSVQIGASAEEARLSARAFRAVSERMSAPAGTLDQLSQSAVMLATTGQTLNAITLPRLNRAVDEAARSARAVSRVADTVADNPQVLIFGNAPAAPGPGEAGFTTVPGKP